MTTACVLTAKDAMGVETRIHVLQVLPGTYNTSSGIYQSPIHVKQAIRVDELGAIHGDDERIAYIAST